MWCLCSTAVRSTSPLAPARGESSSSTGWERLSSGLDSANIWEVSYVHVLSLPLQAPGRGDVQKQNCVWLFVSHQKCAVDDLVRYGGCSPPHNVDVTLRRLCVCSPDVGSGQVQWRRCVQVWALCASCPVQAAGWCTADGESHRSILPFHCRMSRFLVVAIALLRSEKSQSVSRWSSSTEMTQGCRDESLITDPGAVQSTLHRHVQH